MGLDTSHDAFHGAYSAFNRFRQCICEAMGDGSSYPPHWIYGPGGKIVVDRHETTKGELSDIYYPALKKEGLDDDLFDDLFYVGDSYPQESYPGLWEFLSHSDCEGEISPEMCSHIADELSGLLPKIEALGWEAHDHIKARGGFVEVTRKFIAGCRLAAKENKPLVFH